MTVISRFIRFIQNKKCFTKNEDEKKYFDIPSEPVKKTSSKVFAPFFWRSIEKDNKKRKHNNNNRMHT